MGERMDPNGLPYDSAEDAYSGHGSQQERDTSWTNNTVEMYQYAPGTTGFDEPGNPSIFAQGGVQHMIPDLTNESWDHQTQRALASFQHDPAFGNEQRPMNDAEFVHIDAFQSQMPTNNSEPWVSHEPWNPLRVSYGTSRDSLPFHNSGASKQLLSPQIPSQGGMSSESNTRTWITSTSWGDINYTVSTGYTNTGQQSQASSKSVPPGLHPTIAYDSSITGTGPDIRHGAHSPQRSNDHLAVPDDTVSEFSVTPMDVPDILYCKREGCTLKFTGIHRRGTLHRHVRLKHMTGQTSVKQEKTYPCRVESCDKAFKRQDARLKHCRSKHPELGIAAPVRRK